MLTHRILVANIAQTLAALQLRPGDSLVAVMPFFHIYGMQVLMNCGLRAGATIARCPRSTWSSSFRSIRSTGSPGDWWLRRSWLRWPSTRWWICSTSAR
jgi:acyl-CoA synthetase (AMP-forming)/AMP-acid ligase II